jgi:hypothetical protein
MLCFPEWWGIVPLKTELEQQRKRERMKSPSDHTVVADIGGLFRAIGPV